MPILDEERELHPAAKAIRYDVEGECWICTSHNKNFYQYPYVKRDGIHWQMHRYIYQLRVGDLKSSDTVHHLCGRASCINPEHLVTNQEFYRRGIPEDIRQKVYHLHAAGVSYEFISQRFNIAKTSVWRIANEDRGSSNSTR